MQQTLEVRPCPKSRHVFTPQGDILAVPDGWALLEPGDAALTRRVKADGPHWEVKQKKGRKVFSRGVWAPAERIEALASALKIERKDPAYARKLESARARRAEQETAYAEDFTQALRDYLNFHSDYEALAAELAGRISAHASPVGSRTVARTKRITIEQRAEAATIAWLRHQTTAYDNMHIPREKGARREIRRILAKESKRLLQHYREGKPIDIARCPLQKAIRVELIAVCVCGSQSRCATPYCHAPRRLANPIASTE
ncbi:MAG: DUF2293 domain-containing protein [Opitutales bacterium]